MNTRFLAFYSLAIVAVLTLSYLQNLYYPAVPPGNEQQDVAQNAEQESADSDVAQEKAEADSGEATTQKKESDSDDPVEGNIESAQQAIQPTELYSIGALSETGESRYLITIDSAGATVKRVELNFRKSRNSSQFKYRDLEFEGGYLGELDCVNSEKGCKVRVVGEGTPAFAAGLKADDVILAIQDEPIITSDDFLDAVDELSPGQEVNIKYRRGDSETETVAVATDKPIELIRPQPDILEKNWVSRPAFRTSLLEPSQQEVWDHLDSAMMDGHWELETQTSNSIALSFTVSDENLKAAGLNLRGPIKFTKTYSIPVLEEDSTEEKDFHFLMDLKIDNLSDQSQEICYELDGPLGTPTETWWYQNKIHGRNWAIGYIAGARDVVGSSAQEEFTFFGGPEIASNLTKSRPRYFWVLKPPTHADSSSQEINYLSVDTQYFNVALIPQGEEPFTAYSVIADAADVSIPDAVKEQKLVDCTYKMFKIVELEAKSSYQQTFEIFAAPKEAPILEKYSLDDVRSFGWFAMFSKPLCALLRFFHMITFQMGYGIPIILLTILVRSLMVPVSRKAALNAQMMQYLQPQMKEIADKYKDDMEKRGQAQRDLFRKYNYNPLSGCLVGLIQIPIFIGLYRGLSVDIALRDQPLFPGLSWASNLSAPDQLWYWKDSLPSFMGFLTHETGWLGPYLNILPIITCVLFIIQQKMFTPPPTDEQQEMMQKVMKYAMVFMGLMFFKVPAGLCLYFITSSIWGIAERKMLPKPQLDTSKFDSAKDGVSETKFDAKREAKAALEEQNRREKIDEKKRRDKERKKRLKRRDDRRDAEDDHAA